MIETVQADDVLDLRRRVLRKESPHVPAGFEGDDHPDTAHLAIRNGDGVVVATSTWIERPFPDQPDVPALQLRGMAVDPALQSGGLGALLLAAGVELARERGLTLVWANARDTALRFFNRNGFETVGDGFLTADTQLPHHKVVRHL